MCGGKLVGVVEGGAEVVGGVDCGLVVVVVPGDVVVVVVPRLS
jgi:hypothetical protein